MRSTTRGFETYYNPSVGDAVRMDTNTNALGGNPAAERYLRESRCEINGYPNTYSDGLRDALAELYGLERGNFVAGAGSDEMLDLSFKAFTEWGDRSAILDPSYSLYGFFIASHGGEVRTSQLTEDFQLDVDDVVKGDPKIVLLPSPNNPTGNCFRTRDLEEVLSRRDGIVIVDEAYGEYARESMVRRVEEFDNLIVLRTFSKAYAMAALRIGYAVSNRNVASMMNCVKIPYSLNMLSEGAAVAAVKDQDFIRRSVELVREQRPKLARGLEALGFETFPSDSNFILARAPVDHAALVAGLRERGVLVRDFGSKARTENCIRTTVGTQELNDLLLRKTAEVIDGCR